MFRFRRPQAEEKLLADNHALFECLQKPAEVNGYVRAFVR
jgi:hypothetical protein